MLRDTLTNTQNPQLNRRVHMKDLTGLHKSLVRRDSYPRKGESRRASRRDLSGLRTGILCQIFRRGVKMTNINAFVLKHIRAVEMVGVLMRIFSFSLVSWLGPASPFMFVWIFNTIDAILLSWCAILKKDQAYTLLNTFWILVGVVGILRAGNILH